MCKWAIREKIITVNYGQTLKLPDEVKKAKAIFPKTERDMIHETATYRDEAKLVDMMIWTGMRIGELFKLETEKVFDNYCIGGEKTEAGIDRVIPIPPEIRQWFEYFKNRAGGKKYLIEGYAGNRDVANFRNREYYQLLADLGIAENEVPHAKPPHTCRRTFATMARLSGMIPEQLQKILGHAQYSTTANDYIFTEAEIDLLITAAALPLEDSVTQKIPRELPLYFSV